MFNLDLDHRGLQPPRLLQPDLGSHIEEVCLNETFSYSFQAKKRALSGSTPMSTKDDSMALTMPANLATLQSPRSLRRHPTLGNPPTLMPLTRLEEGQYLGPAQLNNFPHPHLQSNSIQTTWQFHRAAPVERPVFRSRTMSAKGMQLTEQRLTRNHVPRGFPIPERILEDPEIELDPDFQGWTPSDGFLNIYNVRITTEYLNIDFSTLNTLTSNLGGWGAYHVGLELYGAEWQYGWCTDGSGICNTAPRGNAEHTYLKSLPLGRAKASSNDLDNILRSLADDWLGCDYNIANKNCIHFAKLLAERLELKELPDWILKLSGYLPANMNVVGSGSCAAPSSRASSLTHQEAA